MNEKKSLIINAQRRWKCNKNFINVIHCFKVQFLDRWDNNFFFFFDDNKRSRSFTLLLVISQEFVLIQVFNFHRSTHSSDGGHIINFDFFYIFYLTSYHLRKLRNIRWKKGMILKKEVFFLSNYCISEIKRNKK